MHLMLVEPEASGHRMVLYARLIIAEAVRRNWRVTLMTTVTALRHEAVHGIKQQFGANVKVMAIADIRRNPDGNVLSLLADQVRVYSRLWYAFRTLGREEVPDHVYVGCLDYFDKVLALLGSPFGDIPFSGMMMNIKHHRRAMGIGPKSRSDEVYDRLFQRLLRNRTLHAVTVIDEAFLVFCKERRVSELSKIRYVPDVGDVSGDASAIGARRYFGVSPDSFVVLVYGSLGERKGVRELLVAARQLKGATVCVLLAGTQSGAVKRLLDDPEFASMVSAGELIVSPGFQSRELEQLVFAACDAVWVGYVGGFTGSSGVLYQAGSVAVPVIATRAGLIGWITRRHQVGLTVEPTNCSEVIAAIERLRDDRELCAQLGQNGQKLARRHSPQQFGRRVCNAIAG